MTKKRIISWLLVILWMGVIFSFSQSNSYQSSSTSRKVVTKIVNTIEKNKTNKEKEKIVDKIHIPFRKFAHSFEYAILSILLLIALKNSNIKGTKLFLLTLIICVVYATTDELHQTLISGRSGEVRDILIDSTGAIVGMLLYYLISKCKKKSI